MMRQARTAGNTRVRQDRASVQAASALFSGPFRVANAQPDTALRALRGKCRPASGQRSARAVMVACKERPWLPGLNQIASEETDVP